ncbi:5'-AMP-activated protein kinase, regulatory beta subunit [Pelomyxa schiedti]|nr:5'-AMP-activated protein kinase, regulatory beta subunit [Pelomyxa schiedti]
MSQTDEPTVSVEIRWVHGGSRASLCGAFSDWKPLPMTQRQEGYGPTFWAATVQLPLRGKHQYKFIVDDVWCYDVRAPTVRDERGNINNEMELANMTLSDLVGRWRGERKLKGGCYSSPDTNVQELEITPGFDYKWTSDQWCAKIGDDPGVALDISTGSCSIGREADGTQSIVFKEETWQGYNDHVPRKMLLAPGRINFLTRDT